MDDDEELFLEGFGGAVSEFRPKPFRTSRRAAWAPIWVGAMVPIGGGGRPCGGGTREDPKGPTKEDAAAACEVEDFLEFFDFLGGVCGTSEDDPGDCAFLARFLRAAAKLEVLAEAPEEDLAFPEDGEEAGGAWSAPWMMGDVMADGGGGGGIMALVDGDGIGGALAEVGGVGRPVE